MFVTGLGTKSAHCFLLDCRLPALHGRHRCAKPPSARQIRFGRPRKRAAHIWRRSRNPLAPDGKEMSAMVLREPMAAEIDRRLQEALARLEKDIATIEIWAGALSGFTQPVPDYEPSNDNLLPSW